MAVLGDKPVREENNHATVVLPRHHSSSDGTTISSRHGKGMNAGPRMDFSHPSDCKAETFATTRVSNVATGEFHSAILLHRLFRPTDG
jgi:hypothetical protein